MATITPDVEIPETRAESAFGPLAVAGMCSLAAGAVHAAAVGAHSDHKQLVLTFVALGAAQVLWGALALTGRSRVLAIIGVALGLGAAAGWAFAKTTGIPFIDGLADAEGIALADGLAAALALIAGIGSARVVLAHGTPRRLVPTWALSALGVGVLVISLVGMNAASTHPHSGDGHGSSVASGHGHGPSSTPSRKYDPTKPIDLGGVQGVTLAQQAKAEQLVAVTLDRLPKFADVEVAKASGFFSIGDAVTGDEHFINWKYLDDDHMLNPDYPEALVYQPQPDGAKKLVAAMFMMSPGSRLDDVPEVGGNLTQWHVHDDLCFTPDPVAPRVAGITSVGGDCNAPLKKLEPVPMIHVWIQSHPCGPFAALEGIGGGQIKEGETRLCDHVHGSGR